MIWGENAMPCAYGSTPPSWMHWINLCRCTGHINETWNPSGKISAMPPNCSVRTLAKSIPRISKNVSIKNVNGADIKLKDVADVVLGPENEESVLKESGVPMIALALVSTRFQLRGDRWWIFTKAGKIKEMCPPISNWILHSTRPNISSVPFSEVKENSSFRWCWWSFIIYLFFREWVIAFRPLYRYSCFIDRCILYHVPVDFTINVPLLAIVLATSLVVDDGIVVTENIFKKMEQGMNRGGPKAPKKGNLFCGDSTSITLAVVFCPSYSWGFVTLAWVWYRGGRLCSFLRWYHSRHACAQR